MTTHTSLLFSFFFLFINCPLFSFQTQDLDLWTDTIAARQLLKKEKELTTSGAYDEALGAVEDARALYAFMGKYCWVRGSLNKTGR